MQRCPYLQEMKERLLRHTRDSSSSNPEVNTIDSQDAAMEKEVLELNPDGYGSHTSPAHRPVTYQTSCDYSVSYFPKNAKTSLFIIMSFIYAKLLVVICIAYVISEVVTHNVPLHYYEGFFTYLYGASILFLLYVFCYLLRENNQKTEKKKKKKAAQGARNRANIFQQEAYPRKHKYMDRKLQTDPEQNVLRNIRKTGKDVNLNDGGSPTQEKLTAKEVKPKKSKITENEHSHGSFFLRIGAIAFGLGTMIYNGLEFGAFFEIPLKSPCYQILRGVNPVLQMIFTFMQMYFIFMNSRLNIHKFKIVARFGLMHVVATNLCVWIRTLVLESLKEITTYRLKKGDGVSEDFMILENFKLIGWDRFLGNASTLDVGAPGLVANNYTCGRINIMGNIVQDSAPYLFPFIIEYSLIGAAVVYVMWSHIGWNPKYVTEDEVEHMSVVSHHFHGRVDCVGASKGLFFGLLLLVGSLICLILFFVLIRHPDLGRLAIYLADVSHCAVMVLSVIAIFIGFIRVQSLKFHSEEQSDLNDILLRVSAFGLFVYAVFSVIAGSLAAFTHEPNLLVMITGILSVVQVVLQLLFIADVSRRRVHLPEQDRSKPGRQVVTFLLICNLTMWVIYTFETQKVEANPVQLDFYGFLAWAIVQRVTLPLCIFHRFHSAVTFAEIWKTSYKARLE